MDIEKPQGPQHSRPAPGDGDGSLRTVAENRRRVIKLALASGPVIWTLTSRAAHAIRPEQSIHPRNAEALERARQRKMQERSGFDDDKTDGIDGADDVENDQDDLQLNAAVDGGSRCSATHSPINDCIPG